MANATPPAAGISGKPLSVDMGRLAKSIAIALGCAVVAAVIVGAAASLMQSQLSMAARLWHIAGYLLVLAFAGSTWGFAALVDARGGTDTQKLQATVIADVVTFILLGLMFLSFWESGSARNWAAGAFWASACLILGGGVGFLFGVPKSRRAAGDNDGNAHQTPVEQISSWLTNVIVGVGLTNVTKIGREMTSWGTVVARGLEGVEAGKQPSPGGVSTAIALVLFFTLVGVLSGYLLTQMFLIGAVNQDGDDSDDSDDTHNGAAGSGGAADGAAGKPAAPVKQSGTGNNSGSTAPPPTSQVPTGGKTDRTPTATADANAGLAKAGMEADKGVADLTVSPS